MIYIENIYFTGYVEQLQDNKDEKCFNLPVYDRALSPYL